ncbi:hypothetical protein EVAR_86262_1 [Eumeta japonica]|uniref:Uncharacterized protein n=1 Tax=Eumeta variegata TaxID=151549 RepID=A0A4C1UBQ0_EUMVA|nr:hypothetical protein EVAR_86262_1 [Eumeta japonica]
MRTTTVQGHAARGHLHFRRIHQCIAGLLDRNSISGGGRVGRWRWEEMGLRGEVAGGRKLRADGESGPPEHYFTHCSQVDRSIAVPQ